MAVDESVRTTGLYDHRGDQVTIDEVERIWHLSSACKVEFTGKVVIEGYMGVVSRN